MTKMQETLIYLVIFSFWLIRLYYKLYDKKTRKYILYIGLLIILWLILRISKSLIDNITINRLFLVIHLLEKKYIKKHYI